VKRLTVSIFVIIWLDLVSSAPVQASWTIEWLGGLVYNLNTPLVIRQSGYDDIRLSARYQAKSLEPPIYYSIRIARGWENYWELEIIHDKLFLKNKPTAIQKFSISHGHNLIIINRTWMYRNIILRVGTGIALVHPETTVRNKKCPENKGIFKMGYYITGPVVQIAVEKQYRIYNRLFAAIEGKFIGSFSRIPISEGNADVLNLAFHGLFGLSYHF
jgi:hypothetical protein